MRALEDHIDGHIHHIAPFLDEAINLLAEDDRAAVMLRFFEPRHSLHAFGRIDRGKQILQLARRRPVKLASRAFVRLPQQSRENRVRVDAILRRDQLQRAACRLVQ